MNHEWRMETLQTWLKTTGGNDENGQQTINVKIWIKAIGHAMYGGFCNQGVKQNLLVSVE